MNGAGEGLQDLFDTFAVIADVHKLFEETELKPRLRRHGLEPVPPAGRQPFVRDAFFGDTVLTRSRRGGAAGVPVEDARCVFYSGVVAHAIAESLVVTLRANRPDLQVGVALRVRTKRWTGMDDDRLTAIVGALGDRWATGRFQRGDSTAHWLAAREDALYLVQRAEDDHLALARSRDEFFKARWEELAGLSDADLEWVTSRV